MEILPRDIIVSVIIPLLPRYYQLVMQFLSRRFKTILPKSTSPARISNAACSKYLAQIFSDGHVSLATWFMDYLTFPLTLPTILEGSIIRIYFFVEIMSPVAIFVFLLFFFLFF